LGWIQAVRVSLVRDTERNKFTRWHRFQTAADQIHRSIGRYELAGHAKIFFQHLEGIAAITGLEDVDKPDFSRRNGVPD
jgi:hypothetical protein